MISAAVQDVNVVRDFWDWLGLLAGIVGALAAAWAIWYATRARQEIIDERGRLFELDVLREIATGIDDGFLYQISDDPMRLRKFARRLDLLPASALPFWREMMTMRWPDDVGRYMGFIEGQRAKSVSVAKWAQVQPPPDAPESERAAWTERYAELTGDLRTHADQHRERVSQKLLDELVHAITSRVEAGRFRESRRTWWGGRRKPVGHVD